ncbi:condensation domain-containing protein [Kitasatospora sp. McL0602]|uniref:condensation domain-containing protein n=1 Tax=Kitasatospora sp. McL0602 TaxID=3439530 RepID=UPI003F8A8932
MSAPGRSGLPVIPLTPQQRGVYFLHCLAPDSAVYNVPIMLRVLGGIDLGRFQLAVDLLQSRHQALRLTVEEREGEILQLIHPAETAAPVKVETAPQPDLVTATAEAVRRAAEPFDIAQGPLWRAAVLELAADEHVVMLSFHHIIIDEISATALAAELHRAYDDPAALDPAGSEHRYADFCTDLAAEPDPKMLDFWRTQLDGLGTLRLPEEHIAQDHGLFTGDRVGFTVPAKISEQLTAVCRAHRVSEFMVFHSALLVLLQRWTGAADIAVGTPMAGRTDARYADTIGFFQNTVVLRNRLDPELTFAGLLKASRRTVLEALQREATPFERVVEAVRPARDAGRNPLFQVALVFNRRKVEQDWTLPGLTVEPLPFSWKTSHFDLTLTMLHEYGVLKGDFAFSAQRLSRETAGHLVSAFQTLLAALLADPAAPLVDAELQSPAEREAVLALGAAAGRYVLDERQRPLPLGFFGAVHTGRFPSDDYTSEDGTGLRATGERGRFTGEGRFELWRDPVEAALAAHPAVLRAAVLDLDGESVGVAVRRPGVTLPGPRELLAHLQARVPGYLLPQRLVELPDGPLDPAALRAALEAAPSEPAAADSEEPQGELEERLAALFEELLGIPGLGRYDNFFDYGGHSLLAVRLIGRITEELGLTVSVGAFMNSPTVSALATAMSDGSATALPSGVVRLRTAAEPDGRPALALLHPVGGTLMCYGELVRLLPDNLDVVGLERVAGAHPADASYRALTDRYATALAEALPGRPIALCGWSLGGVLAHSVAARLTELGHQVVLVSLLDSLAQRTAWDADRMATTGAELAALAALAADVRLHGTGVLGVTPEQQLLMRRFGVDLDALRETPPEQAARMLEDWGQLLALVAECEPEQAGLPVQLVLCADNPAGYPEALAASWEGLHGSLQQLSVPGSHTEVLSSPAVELVAAALTERITRS